MKEVYQIGEKVMVTKGTIFRDQETIIEEVYRNMGTLPWYRLHITKLCLFRHDEIEPVEQTEKGSNHSDVQP